MAGNSDTCLVVSCSNPREFICALSPHSEWFEGFGDPHAWIFRGQSNAEWPLVPSAFRRPIMKRGHKDQLRTIRRNERYNYVQVSDEVRRLRNFFDFADGAGLPLPEDGQLFRTVLEAVWELGFADGELKMKPFPPREIWSLLAIAQHHGIPTRMLDWSWSGHVAAYFAVVELAAAKLVKDDPPLAVWAYVATGHDMWPDEVQKATQCIKIVNSPYAGNKNLAAQKGVHLLHVPADYNSNDLLDPLSLHAALHAIHKCVQVKHKFNALIKFTLPREHARELLWRLAKEHVSAASLFPGFDGAAKAVLEEGLWQYWR